MALASGYGSTASICIGTGSFIWHHSRPRATVNSTNLNNYTQEKALLTWCEIMLALFTHLCGSSRFGSYLRIDLVALENSNLEDQVN